MEHFLTGYDKSKLEIWSPQHTVGDIKTASLLQSRLSLFFMLIVGESVLGLAITTLNTSNENVETGMMTLG